MRDRDPMIQTIDALEARQQFSQLLNKVIRREARVIVEASGVPVAAIISAEDLARLDRLEEERRKDFEIMDEIGAVFADVPTEELEQEVARALAEVRRQHRRRTSRASQTA